MINLKFYNLLDFFSSLIFPLKLNCEKSLQILQNVFNESPWVGKRVPIKIIIIFGPSDHFSHIQLFSTPWTVVSQASLSITSSWSLLKFTSSQWCHPTILLCCPLHLLPSIFPSIRIFSNESVLQIAGQSTGAAASASVLPVNIQDWFPLGLTSSISLLSKGLLRVFSNTTVQKHQLFGTQLSLQSSSHIYIWLLENLRAMGYLK